MPLPSTPQRSDRQQQLLLVNNHYNDSGNGLGLAGQLFQDDNGNNKSESAVVQVSLIRETGSRLFLRGAGMTSPRGKGHQPVLPITENHGNGGGLLSPRQLDDKSNVVTTVIPHGEAKEAPEEDQNPSSSFRSVSLLDF